MKLFYNILLVLLITLLAAAAAFADATPTPTPAPAWKDIVIIPGILAIQESNAEMGWFGDLVSARSYSFAGTNLMKVGKLMDIKIGACGYDTPNPVPVGGAGFKIMDAVKEITLLWGMVTVDTPILDNVAIDVAGGWDQKNNKGMLGLAITDRFPIPNLF